MNLRLLFFVALIAAVQGRPQLILTPEQDSVYQANPIRDYTVYPTRDYPGLVGLYRSPIFVSRPKKFGFKTIQNLLPTPPDFRNRGFDAVMSEEEVAFPGFRPFKEILVAADRMDENGSDVVVGFQESGNSFLGFSSTKKLFPFLTG